MNIMSASELEDLIVAELMEAFKCMTLLDLDHKPEMFRDFAKRIIKVIQDNHLLQGL